MQYNLLMCVDVAVHLPTPWHLSLLCQAGRRGHTTFDELITGTRRATGIGPAYLEITSSVEMGVEVAATESESRTTAPVDAAGVTTIVSTTTPLATTTLFLLPTKIPSSRIPNSPNITNGAVLVVDGSLIITSTSTTTSTTIINPHWVAAEKLRYIWGGGGETTSGGDICTPPTTTTTTTTTLPQSFLSQCRDVREMQLIGFENITSIEQFFLTQNRLTRIDLSSFCNVAAVGRGFLRSSHLLQHLDLSPFSNITVVPDEFLSNCSNLKSIDLTPLHRISNVGSSFMQSCASLTEIDIVALFQTQQQTKIPDGFLVCCVHLQIVKNLATLTSITKIGSNFLSNSGITSIDLSSLTSVTCIDPFFLLGCKDLTTVDLSPFSKSVKYIRDGFMMGCISLTSIDLTPLGGAHTIGDYLLHDSCYFDDTNGINNMMMTAVVLRHDDIDWGPVVRVEERMREHWGALGAMV